MITKGKGRVFEGDEANDRRSKRTCTDSRKLNPALEMVNQPIKETEESLSELVLKMQLQPQIKNYLLNY